MAAYLNNIVALYKNAYRLSLDVPLLGMKDVSALSGDEMSFNASNLSVFVNRSLKLLKMLKSMQVLILMYSC